MEKGKIIIRKEGRGKKKKTKKKEDTTRNEETIFPNFTKRSEPGHERKRGQISRQLFCVPQIKNRLSEI